MKKPEFSCTVSSTNKPPTTPIISPYRTMNSFPRNFECSNVTTVSKHNESLQDDNLQLIRSMVQSQMTGMLRVIKVQIQTKIKEIDTEIRGLRQEVFKIKQSSDGERLQLRVEKLEKATEGLMASVVNQPPRGMLNPEVRTSDVMMRNRSERSLSRERKRIFNKPENSINLSNILFPDEDSQRLQKSNLSTEKNELQVLLRPSEILQHARTATFEQQQLQAPQIHEPQDTLKQDLLIELNRNKAQFLRNKSKPMPIQHIVQPTSPFQVTTAAGAAIRTNTTILEQQHQQSIISSGNKRR